MKYACLVFAALWAAVAWSEDSEANLTRFELGEPLDEEVGLYLPRKHALGFINVRVINNEFHAIFLSEERRVIEPENVAEIILHAESPTRDGDRVSYLLEPSPDVGYIFSDDRYVDDPLYYNVQVVLVPPRAVDKGAETPGETIAYDFGLLNQI